MHKEKAEAADLGGRLPEDGEMYRGLGLYLCRNMMEEYRPGRDYDVTLTPDGMFENITPVEPDPHHRPADFPIRIDSSKTRYRGISAALEALARLMEAHGNAGHASEFRLAIADLPVED